MQVVTIVSGGVSILAPKKQPDDGLPKPSTDNVNITEYARIFNKSVGQELSLCTYIKMQACVPTYGTSMLL